MLSMVLPAGIAQLLYYIKVFVIEKNSGTNLVNIQNAVIIMVVWLITLIYIMSLRNILIKKFNNNVTIIMISALFVGNIVLIVLNLHKAFINLNAEFYNVANEYWGYFPWIALLLCMIVIHFSRKLSYFDLLWIGYILFNFAICMGRAYDLRKGFGDLFNRIIIGAIPIFLFSVFMHMKEYFNERIGGNIEVEANNPNSML